MSSTVVSLHSSQGSAGEMFRTQEIPQNPIKTSNEIEHCHFFGVFGAKGGRLE